MTRINVREVRNIPENHFVAWGKNSGALIFAAVLIACSVTVGCSSDKPKPTNTSSAIQAPQVQSPTVPVTAMKPDIKPVTAPKKVVHKKPATVNYADKTSGVTFEYPRRYAIETGTAATELLASNPIAMNFVQPGGVALAAVELPETSFANTDFSSAFFNVSVHKGLTSDQCSEFAVPAPKASVVESHADAVSTPSTTAVAVTTAPETTATATTPVQPEAQGSKLLIGDMELRATEAVSGEGTRQSDSKYFHAYQNGACYEFALNVTTVASQDGVMKHVDRDKVFGRLETILSTVKINPVAAPEVTAEVPATTAVAPAQ